MTKPTATRPFRLSIRLLVGIGGSLTALFVAASLYLGLELARDNTAQWLGGKAEATLNRLTGRVESLLIPVERQARWMARRIAERKLDPDNQDDYLKVAQGALSALPQIAAIVFVSPDEQAIRVERNAEQIVISPMLKNPQVLRAMRSLQKTGEAQWQPPIYARPLKGVMMSFTKPVLREGVYVGVLIYAMAIPDLSAFLADEHAATGQTPFILYGDDQVLAHPAMAYWHPEKRNESELPGVTELSDQILARIWSPNLRPMAYAEDREVSAVRLVERGEEHLILSRAYSRFGAVPWIMGVHRPLDEEVDIRDRFIHAGLTGLVLLILSVTAALILGRMVSRPITRLARAATLVHDGELGRVEVLPPNNLSEIDRAGTAFNGMVEGLKEREMIREVFGRYVPPAVAQSLLAEGGALEPQSREASILFLDIAGFTPLTERLSPEAVVDLLNAFFSEAVDILEIHGGVVTQFQGDAILATFNLPLAHEDHAARAVAAAKEILAATDEKTFAGQSLACRIGVTTGPVTAGNVGAPGRLSYTVHGDAVNLAARLEQMNKELGTRLLVAAVAAERVPEAGLIAKGEVTVRGQTEPVRVFTLPLA
ncbi:adenylate/guanylate cyclase domain-containing protein [Magnetospira sp. QH-2]|uniref:adenylate/guanylate cyclase domain-containing protein n=1 Tax=Magnetospira sp. (strain QH-2) TaxID=1288970 RepID=UPI0003E8177C|nr:adenylate/guanylate cyclase domain-containing protein [Magnetospira sp. QH-2]CCQ72814.1 putative Adenylate cyclase, contains HAMP domain [Magnetospira sp. QH-2]